VMVASACKVEWYRTPSDGFWNLYLTWLSVECDDGMMTTGQRKTTFERGSKVRDLERVQLTGIERKADGYT
jgi:hypothetical protein